MGSSYAATCNACGHEFEFNDGPSMMAAQLRCDQCGKDEWIRLDAMPPALRSYDYDPADDPDSKVNKCRCGGTFTQEAPPRCPRCRSADLKYNENALTACYD